MASKTEDVIELKPAEWSGVAGERWAASLDKYETMLADAGEALIAHAAFMPGEKVVEIGCGGGATTRTIAGKIAPGGQVTGVDISPALVALSAERAAAAGIDNATFIAADAGTVTLDNGPFDRLTSRFGIMFFADPPAAFANLRALLKKGGRADFAVWAPPAENPAVSALPKVAAAHLNLPKPDPRAPGPFSLSDPEYFRGLLKGAGFIDVTMEKWGGNVHVGGRVNAAQAAAFAMNSSMLADVVAEQPAETREAIQADLEALFAPFDGPDGVAVPSAVWIVTAYAP
jgi:SAM-dependent methyltransferase